MAKRGSDAHGEDELPEMNLPEEFEDEDAELDEDVAEDGVVLDGMEETTDLVTVAQARNMKEARTMKSILESAEITAFLGQEQAGADSVEEVDLQGIPVLVPAEMVAEAEEILAEAAMSKEDEEDEEEIEDEDWDDEEDEDYFDDDSLEDFEDEEDEDYEDYEDLGEDEGP